MANVLKEAEKLRVAEPGGKVKNWPRLEANMAYFQIRSFPRSLHKRLRVLSIQMEKPIAEIATMCIEAGLRFWEVQPVNRMDENE